MARAYEKKCGEQATDVSAEMGCSMTRTPKFGQCICRSMGEWPCTELRHAGHQFESHSIRVQRKNAPIAPMITLCIVTSSALTTATNKTSELPLATLTTECSSEWSINHNYHQ